MSQEPLTADPRVFPIQTKPSYGREQAGIPEPIYRAAYEVYSHIYGAQPAMVDLEGRGCRGGFGVGELIAFLYARAFPKSEWKARSDEAMRGMRGLT